MILLILVLTILFCHSLIRLCMLLLNPRTDIEQGVRVIDRAESEEYAQPEQPIRVVLARDEEIGISGTDDSVGEDDGPTPPPPAYGIWRCSVVSCEECFCYVKPH